MAIEIDQASVHQALTGKGRVTQLLKERIDLLAPQRPRGWGGGRPARAGKRHAITVPAMDSACDGQSLRWTEPAMDRAMRAALENPMTVSNDRRMLGLRSVSSTTLIISDA